jgi:hypothetical protein
MNFNEALRLVSSGLGEGMARLHDATAVRIKAGELVEYQRGTGVELGPWKADYTAASADDWALIGQPTGVTLEGMIRSGALRGTIRLAVMSSKDSDKMLVSLRAADTEQWFAVTGNRLMPRDPP